MMSSSASVPRMTHSQIRLEPDALDAAGELLAGVGGVGVMVVNTVDGAVVGVSDGGACVGGGVAVAGALAVGESRMTAPLAACAHAVARHPVTRMAAASSTLFKGRLIRLLPRV
jgi:hypothetical protein